MMRDYQSDYGWRNARPVPRTAYDMQFGNWGARSGLEGQRWGTESRPGHGGPPDPSRDWSRPSQYGSRAGYDTSFPSPHRPSFGEQPRDAGRRSARYDEESGWGMSRLHHEMMSGHGEGFEPYRDYNRSHPIHPREGSEQAFRGGPPPAGRYDGWSRGGPRPRR